MLLLTWRRDSIDGFGFVQSLAENNLAVGGWKVLDIVKCRGRDGFVTNLEVFDLLKPGDPLEVRCGHNFVKRWKVSLDYAGGGEAWGSANHSGDFYIMHWHVDFSSWLPNILIAVFLPLVEFQNSTTQTNLILSLMYSERYCKVILERGQMSEWVSCATEGR